MADEPTGTDLTNGRMEIAPGIVVDDRLRLGGVLYLEQKCGKSLTEIFEGMTGDNPKFSDMATLLKALYMQANSSATEEQAEAMLAQLELSAVSEAFTKLKVFEFAPKNGNEPTPTTPNLPGP